MKTRLLSIGILLLLLSCHSKPKLEFELQKDFWSTLKGDEQYTIDVYKVELGGDNVILPFEALPRHAELYDFSIHPNAKLIKNTKFSEFYLVLKKFHNTPLGDDSDDYQSWTYHHEQVVILVREGMVVRAFIAICLEKGRPSITFYPFSRTYTSMVKAQMKLFYDFVYEEMPKAWPEYDD